MFSPKNALHLSLCLCVFPIHYCPFVTSVSSWHFCVFVTPLFLSDKLFLPKITFSISKYGLYHELSKKLSMSSPKYIFSELIFMVWYPFKWVFNLINKIVESNFYKNYFLITKIHYATLKQLWPHCSNFGEVARWTCIT